MFEDTGRFLVRTYVDGDEIEIVRLFNEVYGGFGGFVPRTPGYWRWCCLNRPDVDPRGIAIVNDDLKTVGYAVVGKSGNIWELCYDPTYEGEEIASTLLGWAINYVEKAGGDSITLNAPGSDHLLRDLCTRSGFAEVFPPFMFVSVLDFPGFFLEVVNSNREKLRRINGEFLIRLRASPSWHGGNVSVEINDGKVSIREVEEEATAGVTIETDVPTIASCIMGTSGLLRVFLSSKFKVRPMWKYLKVWRLFSSIRIEDKWFNPGADIG